MRYIITESQFNYLKEFASDNAENVKQEVKNCIATNLGPSYPDKLSSCVSLGVNVVNRGGFNKLLDASNGLSCHEEIKKNFPNKDVEVGNKLVKCLNNKFKLSLPVLNNLSNTFSNLKFDNNEILKKIEKQIQSQNKFPKKN